MMPALMGMTISIENTDRDMAAYPMTTTVCTAFDLFASDIMTSPADRLLLC
jgi:hypothetical protein